MVTFRTYQAVWSWERRLYKIERVRLPMAVSLRWVGCAIGSLFFVVIPLNALPFISGLPWAPIRYALPPILIANWLTKAKLDGKPPLAWLVCVARYLVMHKRWARYRPIKLGARARFRVQAFCRHSSLTAQRHDSEVGWR